MNIAVKIKDFDNKNLYYCDPIKNNIMNDASFIRILYSNSFFTLNGVYIYMKLLDISCEKHYNKYKINYNNKKNISQIEGLKKIEQEILDKYQSYKQPSFKIQEQFDSYYIKLFHPISEKNISLILKISGIWENNTNYGLTYKIYPSVV